MIFSSLPKILAAYFLNFKPTFYHCQFNRKNKFSTWFIVSQGLNLKQQWTFSHTKLLKYFLGRQGTGGLSSEDHSDFKSQEKVLQWQWRSSTINPTSFSLIRLHVFKLLHQAKTFVYSTPTLSKEAQSLAAHSKICPQKHHQ